MKILYIREQCNLQKHMKIKRNGVNTKQLKKIINVLLNEKLNDAF